MPSQMRLTGERYPLTMNVKPILSQDGYGIERNRGRMDPWSEAQWMKDQYINAAANQANLAAVSRPGFAPRNAVTRGEVLLADGGQRVHPMTPSAVGLGRPVPPRVSSFDPSRGPITGKYSGPPRTPTTPLSPEQIAAGKINRQKWDDRVAERQTRLQNIRLEQGQMRRDMASGVPPIMAYMRSSPMLLDHLSGAATARQQGADAARYNAMGTAASGGYVAPYDINPMFHDPSSMSMNTKSPRQMIADTEAETAAGAQRVADNAARYNAMSTAASGGYVAPADISTMFGGGAPAPTATAPNTTTTPSPRSVIEDQQLQLQTAMHILQAPPGSVPPEMTNQAQNLVGQLLQPPATNVQSQGSPMSMDTLTQNLDHILGAGQTAPMVQGLQAMKPIFSSRAFGRPNYSYGNIDQVDNTIRMLQQRGVAPDAIRSFLLQSLPPEFTEQMQRMATGNQEFEDTRWGFPTRLPYSDRTPAAKRIHGMMRP